MKAEDLKAILAAGERAEEWYSRHPLLDNQERQLTVQYASMKYLSFIAHSLLEEDD